MRKMKGFLILFFMHKMMNNFFIEKKIFIQSCLDVCKLMITVNMLYHQLTLLFNIKILSLVKLIFQSDLKSNINYLQRLIHFISRYSFNVIHIHTRQRILIHFDRKLIIDD